MHRIEYQVRPITRYIVTRWETEERNGQSSGGCDACGEFENDAAAYQVGYALAKAEHDRLGWPAGDGRIRYPEDPSAKKVRKVGVGE